MPSHQSGKDKLLSLNLHSANNFLSEKRHYRRWQLCAWSNWYDYFYQLSNVKIPTLKSSKETIEKIIGSYNLRTNLHGRRFYIWFGPKIKDKYLWVLILTEKGATLETEFNSSEFSIKAQKDFLNTWGHNTSKYIAKNNLESLKRNNVIWPIIEI